MSFLYPTFLFALFAVLIPVIIHLFNFRTYKTVYFSNVQFLKDIKKETKSKSKLKNLLLLLLRILTISALIFAFAGPYIPEDEQNHASSQNLVGIYVDNSFSTQSESKYGKIIETEKKKALETAEAYPEDTKFLFLNNDFDLKHRRPISKEQLKEYVLNTKLSPVVRKASTIISKMQSNFRNFGKNKSNYTIYYFSDFQKTSSDLPEIKIDSNAHLVFIPVLTENEANLFIDSLWFENPNRPLNQADKLYFSITNTSDKSYTQMPVKLFINDSIKASGSFDIEPHSQTSEFIQFTNSETGIIDGRLEISDFPVSFDNVFYFSFTLTKTHKILILKENGFDESFVSTVFTGLKNVEIKTSSPAKINSLNLNDYNAVISVGLHEISAPLKAAFTDFTEAGGSLVIFPKINCNTNTYNDFFNAANLNYITGFDTAKTDIGRINYKSEVMQNVFKKEEKNIDLPYIAKRIIFSNLTNVDEEVILYSEKNDKLLFAADVNKGKVFVFAQNADASSGNLVYHPLWVSLLYNMVFYNAAGKDIYYTAGSDFSIKLNAENAGRENVFRIIDKQKKKEIIPQAINTEGNRYKLLINDLIQMPGQYKIVSGKNTVKGIALNYDRRESYLEKYSEEALNSFISESALRISLLKPQKALFKENVMSRRRGTPLKNIFLAAALLFIALEIALIKFLK